MRGRRGGMASWSHPAVFTVCCALMLGGACGSPAPSRPGSAPASAVDGGVAASTLPKKSKEEVVAVLEPVIREQGASGHLPERIVIEFARPLIDPEKTERHVHKDTVLKLEPELDGELSYQGPSTLVFTPHAPFRPQTTYHVKLTSVHTPWGTVKPEAGKEWAHSFQTPAFRFVEAILTNFVVAAPKAGEKPEGAAEIQLFFNGPVAAEGMRKYLTWSVGTQAPTSVDYNAGNEPSVVLAKLRGAALKPDSTIKLVLKAGVPLAHVESARAQAGGATFALVDFDKSPLVEMVTVRRGETPQGHYLDVVCSDGALKGDTEYFYDSEGDGRDVSGRCMLDEESIRTKVQIHPNVKVQVSPARFGFRLMGDFRRGSYTIKVGAGARTIDGGVVRTPFEKSITVPARKPSVGLVSSGRYLPRKAWRNLPITHLNVDEATLTVRQVPPENLVFWMGGSEPAGERESNVILKKTLKLKSVPDSPQTTFIDIGALVPSTTQGLLQISLNAVETREVSARLLLTNLHLVAKRSQANTAGGRPTEVAVWTLDMDTGTPQSGVEVKLVRRSGFVVSRCLSAGVGACILQYPVNDVDASAPFALVAGRSGDLTYLKFDDLKTSHEDFDVSGESYRDDSPYSAAIYSDRGVYRPGETAHLVGIVRDRSYVAPHAATQGGAGAGKFPVVLEIKDPKQNTYRRSSSELNAAGMWSLDVPFADFAATGRYELSVSAGGHKLGSYGVQVEEFVPERMKVDAVMARADLLPGEEIGVDVSARYLFGSVAAGERVELTCDLAPAEFMPEENRAFHYGIWHEAKPKAVALGSKDDTLNNEGRGRLGCPDENSEGRFPGTGLVTARAAVFESGSGRSSQAVATALVHPERYYVGLSSTVREVRVGDSVPITGVVVDWGGKLNTKIGQVKLEFLQIEEQYGWYYDEVSHSGSSRHYRRPVMLGQMVVPVHGGRFATTWQAGRDASAFLIRATSGKAQTDLELKGTWERYRDWEEAESEESERTDTPRPNKPAAMKIKGPDRVVPGEQTQISVRAPYRGQMLFTVESDHVHEAQWVHVAAANSDVTWTFRIGQFAPNVYVSAFLIKDPHADSRETFTPDRAFGVLSIPVDRSGMTQGMRLTAPKEVRSNTRFDVRLDLDVDPQGGQTFVTVAAVDEGILALTKFATPDPLGEILKRRALGVETFETIGWTFLLPQSGPGRKTGGGDDGEGGRGGKDAAGRVSPIKPVALWSGLVTVPESGQVTIPFSVPQYRGALRIMAVAAGKRRIGSASAQLLVRDPLVLQTTLPRFLLDGDEATIPVSVTNLSGGGQDVSVTLTAEDLPIPNLALPPSLPGNPPVVILGDARAQLKLKNGAAGVTRFRIRGNRTLGAAKLRVVAKAGALESREELDVPLNPASPRERIVQRVTLSAGKRDLSSLLTGWTAGSERTTFWATSNPYGDVFDHLAHLIHYPYGCIEQTTSSTRPLLYVANLLNNIDPTLISEGKLEQYVMHGVMRVLSMQTAEGGFAYWPGGTTPHPWGTAYATHMLIDAQKQGYLVPAGRLQDAIRYLENELTSRIEVGRADYGNYYSGNPEAYMQYVLALAGRGHKGRIQKLIDTQPSSPVGEQAEHPYLLKAALYLAGDRRYESDLKRPDLSPVVPARWNDWSFYSDRRRRGMMLSIFQDLFGADPAGEGLADLVAGALRGQRSHYYTTQELVWGITGLGKRVGQRSHDIPTVTLAADGRRLGATPPSAKGAKEKASSISWSLLRASEYRSVTLDVAGTSTRPLYLFVTSEGIRQKPDLTEGSEGLEITRAYYKMDGNALTAVNLTDGSIRLGDLVFVELTVRNSGKDEQKNIALVDRLPAGFEIENPRLGRSYDWMQEKEDSLWSLEHMNMRDDRMELFGHLESREIRKYFYAVRAVTAGAFKLPMAFAEAMYDPAIWAREGGGSVVIAAPSGGAP